MKQVYLLGAGFTRAIMGTKAPLTDEIMPKLDLSGFPEIIGDYEDTFPDIEQFITQLDLRCLRFAKNNISLSKRLNEIRDNIIEQIVRIFDVDALSVDSLDKFPTLKKFTDIVPNHSTILTLNYDCVLDQALYLSGRWSPGGGYYASSFPYGSNNDNENNNTKDNILLLKLHGSCNFRDSFENSDYYNIEVTDKIFPGTNTYCNERNTSLDKGAHVLVMSYLKIYHNGIMQLWTKAVEDLRNADRLTIIGCSLREEDIFLKFALYHFGGRDKVTELFIDIIDVNKKICDIIENKIKRLCSWPDKHKIMQYNDGLKKYLEDEKQIKGIVKKM